MHRWFETQAEAKPETIAITCGDVEISYRDLNAQANQLARELVRLGIGPDSLVGICLDRSPRMVVALLAVLKAGGAYVPLDPSYPQERLRFMLCDADVSVLLTETNFLEKLNDYNGPRLCLDADCAAFAAHSIENLALEVAPENLAYVIYTSGSTGQPKGAMITHRGLANYLRWAADEYDVANGCGALLHSSISFDLTVTSLFTPLIVGRGVFLTGDGVEALAEALLARTNYSLVKITPAHLRALAELLPANEIAGRARALIIGGEALHFESLAFWRKHAPATRLINEYGPTETVVGCCVYEVAPEDPDSGPVPIGRAIANTQLRVLAADLTPVTEGEMGELFIGGDGVACGYLNRTELTRERFVTIQSQRMYRSGDLVRTMPDGNLAYAGRVDDQVKIRGYRIELGEIETVLRQHDAVSDCAVVVCDAAGDEKRMVAFIVENRPADDDIRAWLETRLPEYMVPTGFVHVDSLPLTINGKVDRIALSAQAPAAAADAAYVKARTPAEETLAGIWSEVLKVDPVGVNDNFFDLGGDSILGTLILARAARAGLKLSPSQLFEYQTIAELATVAVSVN
ncbi:MAG TPA: non-ribosomal peptide synthetase [Pyrinomonadaceae bacterium]|nr:non-ribosomal peptide synthetase [Pyrinomonadaceae bacterium]